MLHQNALGSCINFSLSPHDSRALGTSWQCMKTYALSEEGWGGELMKKIGGIRSSR